MASLTMRTRKLDAQRPIDITLDLMPANGEGDKPEVVVTLEGWIEEQRAVVGLRPKEAARLGRLLIKASEAVA